MSYSESYRPLKVVGYSLENEAKNTTWPFYGLEENNRGGKVPQVVNRFIARIRVIRLQDQHAEEIRPSQAQANASAQLWIQRSSLLS